MREYLLKLPALPTFHSHNQQAEGFGGIQFQTLGAIIE
jgi:hypothetical protein